MKYSTQEALNEIRQRSRKIERKHDRRAVRALSGISCVLCAALVVAIAGAANGGASVSTGTAYGAFFLSCEAGGYVLAAVILFLLGVAVTLLCLRARKAQRRRTAWERCDTK